ncbi:MAG TPA: nucleotidyltransferase family protein [Candidatus Sulfotelmatobacter sp.]|nr:nucleotidyltransferase family protein [Candidatus Sulfotelmatobacter sp.]
MKAFLLAAGHGTRLRPITDTLPKCLVPIQGVPMLSIWFNLCKKFGIDEVLINLHARADAVLAFLEQRKEDDIRVHLAEEEELLGSAGTLRANRKWVEKEDSFWIFYADVLHRADLRAMSESHRRRGMTATLGVYEVPDPSRCGIVTTTADGVIQEFVEKPKHPKSNLAFSGLMIGTPALLDAIPSTGLADIGFDVLPKLTGQMLAFPIHDYLVDIGTLENYQRAQTSWPGL